MKVHRELKITGSTESLKQVIRRLEERAHGDWRRDHKAEERVGRRALGAMYCFSCAAGNQRHAASLWLAQRRAERELYVSNVVPSEVKQLDYDEYNRIVKEFYDVLLVPALEGTGARGELGPDVVSLDAWLSPQAIQELRAFSAGANRGTGSSHPADKARWYAFIFTAHREGSPLFGSDLRRWLEEEEHWHEDGAAELESEYETARDLLKAYDESQG